MLPVPLVVEAIAGITEGPNHSDCEAERPNVAHPKPTYRRPDVCHRIPSGEGGRVGGPKEPGGQGGIALDDLRDVPQAGQLVGQGLLDLQHQHRQRRELLSTLQQRLKARAEFGRGLHRPVLRVFGATRRLKMTSSRADTFPPGRTANPVLRQG